jgi:DNA polymerase-3 subunit gamma/tau
VLDQLIAALRECLLASVGCDPSMLTRSQGLGVDLAALGGSMGTATLLAMLQILDQSLSRMRTSGHAALLAEMAVIRLATLEDLESVSAAVDRLASATGPVAAVPASAGNVASRTAPAGVAAPAPQKKTTDLTDRAVEPAPSAITPPAPPVAITPTPELPADASAAWKAASATLEGLAGDCAAEAIGAAWREDQLEVTLPAHATTAAAFLRRSEVSAAISRALESLAGRRVRHAIVMLEAPAEPAVATPVEQPRPASVQTQASLLREAGEHPLVAHARTLFDAAIRKVEPPRPREPRAMASAASVASAAEPGEAAGDGDDGGVTNDESGHVEEQHG